MNDYMPQYEEYKKTLLKSWYFMDTFDKRRRVATSFAADAIGQFVPLWGLAPAACGACFVFFSMCEEGNIIGRIIFAIIGVVAFSLGIYALSKFKKYLGESFFYSFVYDGYVEAHVRDDKQKETERLLREAIGIMAQMQEHADDYSLIEKCRDIQERSDSLYRYDSFKNDLKNDYYFSKAMHEYF